MRSLQMATSTLALVAALTGCAEDPSTGLSRGSRNGGGPLAGGSALVIGGGKNGSAGAAASKASCASTTITAGRKQPIVTLVIDGSGSMCAPFGDSTRWTALRSALLDADGIVPRLQGVVSFGMTMYDGPLEFGGILGGLGGFGMAGGGGQNPQCALMGAQNSMGKSCPNLISVPVALNNAMAITTMYPTMELGGSTPTHKALKVVVDHLLEQTASPDSVMNPQYIILATDGEPNELCATPSGQDPRAEVIAEVTRAADENIKTFVISLADNDAALMSHLVDVAAAGKTNNPPFSPMNKQDLVATLGQIIGGAVGCEVFLNGKVMAGQECGGSVNVNGTFLKCGDPNGWALKDQSTLILQGNACTTFLNNPFSMLNADFPCGIFSPS
ncbi:MAG TPA: VWA domain-containing protein [Polyangiales bacterium]|nr:VWA domain-containing protein [Polyangiales bacterium]